MVKPSSAIESIHRLRVLPRVGEVWNVVGCDQFPRLVRATGLAPSPLGGLQAASPMLSACVSRPDSGSVQSCRFARLLESSVCYH